MSRKPPVERLLARTVWMPDNCWLVRGKPTTHGYSTVGIQRDGKPVPVKGHRLAYEHFVGRIPEGLCIDHLCHTAALAAGTCEGGRTCPHRMCVNPAHLRLVTAFENNALGSSFSALNGRKTHCKRGHAFTPDNIRWQWNRDGSLKGRACRREVAKRQPPALNGSSLQPDAGGSAALPAAPADVVQMQERS